MKIRKNENNSSSMRRLLVYKRCYRLFGAALRVAAFLFGAALRVAAFLFGAAFFVDDEVDLRLVAAFLFIAITKPIFSLFFSG